MAHFYGDLQGQGQGPKVSRVGSKSSGLRTTAASWEGAVTVSVTHDESTGHDYAVVSLMPWHGSGVNRQVFAGRIDGEPDTADAKAG